MKGAYIAPTTGFLLIVSRAFLQLCTRTCKWEANLLDDQSYRYTELRKEMQVVDGTTTEQNQDKNQGQAGSVEYREAIKRTLKDPLSTWEPDEALVSYFATSWVRSRRHLPL